MAFRDMAAGEDKAIKAAGAPAKRDDDVDSLQADVLLKRRMLGFVSALRNAFAFKLFAH